jgi:hypothetical protein
MKIRKAERKQLKARISVVGASGHGKSRAALEIAYGLCNDWSKIMVADTEYESSLMLVGTDYDGFEIGQFYIGDIEAPYTTDKYLDAIETAEREKMKVLILDNFSHEWDGEGGINDWVSELGGKFHHWKAPKKAHNRLIERIMHSPLHIITTVRAKQEYVEEVNEKGKKEYKKVGMKPQQSNDYDFLFTTVFMMREGTYATVTKDRTHLFHDFDGRITPEIGEMFLDWLVKGKPVKSIQERKISAIQTISGLYREDDSVKRHIVKCLQNNQVRKIQELSPSELFSLEEQVKEIAQQTTENQSA